MYVGIKVWNATNPDPNPANNTLARLDRTINVTPTDRTTPSVVVTPPGILERGHPAVITARVTDPSGIRSVTLTLTRPSNLKTTYTMNSTDGLYYSFTIMNTSLLGIYGFTITAIDASPYYDTTTVSQSFRVIQDQTPPTLNYTGALPVAQLPGGIVTVSCLTWDFSGIRSVVVYITTPQSTIQSFTMTKNKEGYYFLNYSFETIGKYTYEITSTDIYNNTRSSVPAAFWITNALNDTDGDGMPDAWEQQYGFDPYNPADASLDADHDGFSNLQEDPGGNGPASCAPVRLRL